MKNIYYLPIILLLTVTAACGSHQSHVKENAAIHQQINADKGLYGVMSIKNTIRSGDSILLRFTVHNPADSTQKFLKWQTPFEPLLSKYLEIKDEQGQEVDYKGAMAKRMMPPPAGAYISIGAKDSLVTKVDLLKGYAINKPGKYTISYTSENVSGLKVPQSVSSVYQQ